MKPYSFATLLALVLLVASATGRPALAARSLDPAPAIPPLDVVVVIDQSGSMSGSGGIPASDPEALRVSAVKDLATLLGAYGQSSDVRFAVIDFGGNSSLTPVLTVPLTQMNPATAANNVIPRLRSTDLGSTEFRDPLCLAWLVVSGASLPAGVQCNIPLSERTKVPLAAPSRDRRKLAILITDGSPANGRQELPFSANDPQACGANGSVGYAYMCNLDSLWSQLNQVQPVELNVIGLDVNNTWWPTVERYWRLIARCDGPCAQTRVTSCPCEIEPIITRQVDSTPRSFANICPVTPAGGSRVNTCTMEPGLSEVRFTITSSGGEIRVTTPSGAPPPADRLNRLLLPKKEVWIISFPDPGDWRIESTDPTATLDVQALKTAASLAFETYPAKPIAGEEFEVRAKVQNRDGRGALNIPEKAAPFDVTLNVSRDGKSVDSRVLHSIADQSQDVYKFTPPLRLDIPGEYTFVGTLKVGANTFASGNTPLTVMSPPPPLLSIASRTVAAKTREVTLPSPSFPLRYSQPATLRLHVALGNPDIQVDPYRLARWLKADVPVTGTVTLTLENCNHGETHCDLFRGFSFPAGNGEADIEVKLPDDWRDSGKIRSEADVDVAYLDGSPARLTSEAAEITIERPPWDRPVLGVIIPLLGIVVILISLSYGDVMFSRPLDPALPYRDLATWRRSSAAAYEGLVSWKGLMIWRSFPAQGESKKAVLARRYLICGNLTLRGEPVEEPDTPPTHPADDPPGALEELRQRMRPVLRRMVCRVFGRSASLNDGNKIEFPLGDPAVRTTDRIVVARNPESGR